MFFGGRLYPDAPAVESAVGAEAALDGELDCPRTGAEAADATSATKKRPFNQFRNDIGSPPLQFAIERMLDNTILCGFGQRFKKRMRLLICANGAKRS